MFSHLKECCLKTNPVVFSLTVFRYPQDIFSSSPNDMSPVISTFLQKNSKHSGQWLINAKPILMNNFTPMATMSALMSMKPQDKASLMSISI